MPKKALCPSVPFVTAGLSKNFTQMSSLIDKTIDLIDLIYFYNIFKPPVICLMTMKMWGHPIHSI